MGVEDFDQELHDDIEELVARGVIERGSKPYGIAQQAIDRGYNSLSEPQRYVFDSVIVPARKELYEEREANRIKLSNPD